MTVINNKPAPTAQPVAAAPAAAPKVPTMTTASTIPPIPEPRQRFVPEELREDIVARPLCTPDFAMDVKANLVNPNLSARWIFTDRRRYSQAVAQGWRNCTKQDLKPGFSDISPFEEEGGTKYLNGDLILMVIDRRIYLGALRYKHQVAANLADTRIANSLSKRQAQGAMGEDVGAVNKWMEKHGRPPVMEAFDPNNEGVGPKGVMADANVANKEMSRMGSGPRDTGLLADMANKVEKT